MSTSQVVASRLLIAAIGPFTVALELDAILGLLPASARLVPVPGPEWVLGRVKHRGEEIPWISLCEKLGYQRTGEATRGIIFDLAGFAVAAEVDEFIGVTGGGEATLMPLPFGTSEIPDQNLPGVVRHKGGEALLLRMEGLFDEDEVVQIGGALYS